MRVNQLQLILENYIRMLELLSSEKARLFVCSLFNATQGANVTDGRTNANSACCRVYTSTVVTQSMLDGLTTVVHCVSKKVHPYHFHENNVK